MGGVAHTEEIPVVPEEAPVQGATGQISPKTQDIIARMFSMSLRMAPGSEGLSDDLVASFADLRDYLIDAPVATEEEAAYGILGMISGMARIIEDRQELFDTVMSENENYERMAQSVMDRLVAGMARNAAATEPCDQPAE